jgi:hypothetical protein
MAAFSVGNWPAVRRSGLDEWKLEKEVWRCGTILLFSVLHCYLKEQIHELLANKYKSYWLIKEINAGAVIG